MSEVNQDRYCPLCEQIVPREQEGVLVVVSPSRRVMLHDGCAKLVYNSLKKIYLKNKKN